MIERQSDLLIGPIDPEPERMNRKGTAPWLNEGLVAIRESYHLPEAGCEKNNSIHGRLSQRQACSSFLQLNGLHFTLMQAQTTGTPNQMPYVLKFVFLNCTPELSCPSSLKGMLSSSSKKLAVENMMLYLIPYTT